jgi:hypothetical protein
MGMQSPGQTPFSTGMRTAESPLYKEFDPGLPDGAFFGQGFAYLDLMEYDKAENRPYTAFFLMGIRCTSSRPSIGRGEPFTFTSISSKK